MGVGAKLSRHCINAWATRGGSGTWVASTLSCPLKYGGSVAYSWSFMDKKRKTSYILRRHCINACYSCSAFVERYFSFFLSYRGFLFFLPSPFPFLLITSFVFVLQSRYFPSIFNLHANVQTFTRIVSAQLIVNYTNVRFYNRIRL